MDNFLQLQGKRSDHPCSHGFPQLNKREFQSQEMA